MVRAAPHFAANMLIQRVHGSQRDRTRAVVPASPAVRSAAALLCRLADREASRTLGLITSKTPRPSVRQTTFQACAAALGSPVEERVVIFYSVCLPKSNHTD